MNITLNRKPAVTNGIFGEFLAPDGSHLFFTLEHNYGGLAKLAAGAYTCKRFESPKHGWCFIVTGVPDFQGQKVTYIEIHIGCYNRDSEGCILVGTAENPDMITGSRTAFDAFMALQVGIDSFQLTVNDPV